MIPNERLRPHSKMDLCVWALSYVANLKGVEIASMAGIAQSAIAHYHNGRIPSEDHKEKLKALLRKCIKRLADDNPRTAAVRQYNKARREFLEHVQRVSEQ